MKTQMFFGFFLVCFFSFCFLFLFLLFVGQDGCWGVVVVFWGLFVFVGFLGCFGVVFFRFLIDPI